MNNKNNALSISKKSFFISFIILLILIIISGVLTKVITPGSFDRVTKDSKTVIIKDSYKELKDFNYPIWRWFSASVEIFNGPESLTLIVIILFILFIGGSFSVLNSSNLIEHNMNKIVYKYRFKKYTLLRVLILFFMSFGSIFGIFEELIALLPIVMALCYYLGFDTFTALGVSTLASGFGFSSATLNPFTLGVAQSLTGLPLFSGIIFRILIFIIIYFILSDFIIKYAKKIEKKDTTENFTFEDKKDISMEKATKVFLVFLSIIMIAIVSGFFIKELSKYSLPIVALLFLVASIISSYIAYYKTHKGLFKTLISGMLSILPAILLIIMAMSVKQIFSSSMIMDTILFNLSNTIKGLNPYLSILVIYMIVIFLNFFIGSGSAKAFLIIPLIIPITDLLEITRQTSVQAFIFGDGFSNMIYPTNAVLMIALGITNTNYIDWFKWTYKLQLKLFIISIIILFISVFINYGPF